MRIFIDVGAHYGETLNVALDPRWAFDRVYSLEPSQDCQRMLRRFRDPRIALDDRGLSDRTQTAELFGAGLLGGSVYVDKPQGEGGQTETISLVRASDWMREHTSPADDVYLKLNCEGSEADVLDDLLDSGELARIRSVYVDFDIRKIPSQAHRQQGIETRLREAGISFATPETLGGERTRAVALWLESTSDRFPATPAARLRHLFRWHLPLYMRAKAVARVLLPGTAFQWLARRFGRQGRRVSPLISPSRRSATRERRR
jgi:FkbM family methyltransferase